MKGLFMKINSKKHLIKTYDNIYHICSLTCHQRDDRSFFIKGHKFPLCARCSGIVSGYFISILFNIFIMNFSLLISLLMLIPMTIDASLQKRFHILSTNPRRFITGFICGFAVFSINFEILKLIFSF